MSETLESAGFSRKQSTAVVKSVARAMQTFSVTPEVLETHFSRHSGEVSRMFSDHKDEMLALFTSHKDETLALFTNHKDETQQALSDHKSEMKQLFAEHKADTNRRFDNVDEELRDLRNDMHAFQRSMTRLFWGFTLLVLGTALTALVTLLAQ